MNENTKLECINIDDLPKFVDIQVGGRYDLIRMCGRDYIIADGNGRHVFLYKERFV